MFTPVYTERSLLVASQILPEYGDTDTSSSSGEHIPVQNESSFTNTSASCPAHDMPHSDTNAWANGASRRQPVGHRLVWQNIVVKTKKPVDSFRNVLCCRGASKMSNPQACTEILHNVSGRVEPGTILAILGPNGAGRTTLLNVLSQRTDSGLNAKGTVLLNGSESLAKRVPSLSAYIEEHDIFNGCLTVLEHLTFQAALRVAGPRKEKVDKVQSVLKRLGLLDCAHTIIGTPGIIKGLSGGEKKRLSFASEMLTEPSILFADEPTTGLDSYMAENVIRKLKEMAREGKTIICTVRTVSSEVYAMFDHIMLMSEGRVAFEGLASDVVPYFNAMEYRCPAAYNPADFFMALLSVQDGPEYVGQRGKIHAICDLFEQGKEGTSGEGPSGEGTLLADMSSEGKQFEIRRCKRPSWLVQFWCILCRSWMTNLRDVGVYRLRMLTTVLLALLCGLCSFQVSGGWHDMKQVMVINVSGSVYMLLFMCWDNAFVMVSSFTKEQEIFQREFANGLYGYTVYFVGRVLSSAPHYLYIATVWVFILYWLEGLQPEAEIFLLTYLLIFILLGICSGYGALLATWFNGNMTLTFQVGPNPLIVFFLVGGKFLNIASLPGYLYWLQFLSWFRYGYEILMVTQWSPVKNITCDAGLDSECFHDGKAVIDSYSFAKETTLTFDYVALVVMCLVYYSLAYTGMAIRCHLLRKNR